MKAMRKYEVELKKLLASAKKTKPSAPDTRAPAVRLVRSILESDASKDQVESALSAIDREFVDYNELRGSPAKDVVEIVGKTMPNIRSKAETIVRVLNRIFDVHYSLSLEHMEKMPKRELRKHLVELGLDNYASAYLMLTMFDSHAIPVDRSLVEVLEIHGLVPPGSSVEDVQKTLEKLVSHKDALATHEFLRGYIAKNSQALAERRRKIAQQEAAAAKAAAQAEAARQAAAAAAAAAAQAQAHSSPAPSKASSQPVKKATAAAKKTSPKPVAKPSAVKTVKKPAAKAAKPIKKRKK